MVAEAPKKVQQKSNAWADSSGQKQTRPKRAIINCAEFPLRANAGRLDAESARNWAEPIETVDFGSVVSI